jgi:hypothetical protein
LIGYFGRDAYRLFDKSTGKMYRSRDVIFEEGIGNRTLGTQPVSNEGEIDRVILQPTNNTQPNPGLVPIAAIEPVLLQPTLPQPALPDQQLFDVQHTLTPLKGIIKVRTSKPQNETLRKQLV